MNPKTTAAALKDIRRERDPNLKAQKLASLVSALFRAHGIDWCEVCRVANSHQYRIFSECEALVGKVARELKTQNPFDTD